MIETSGQGQLVAIFTAAAAGRPTESQTDVKAALAHRGGLRARIITGGTIRVGEPVLWRHATAAPPAEKAGPGRAHD